MNIIKSLFYNFSWYTRARQQIDFVCIMINLWMGTWHEGSDIYCRANQNYVFFSALMHSYIIKHHNIKICYAQRSPGFRRKKKETVSCCHLLHKQQVGHEARVWKGKTEGVEGLGVEVGEFHFRLDCSEVWWMIIVLSFNTSCTITWITLKMSL